MSAKQAEKQREKLELLERQYSRLFDSADGRAVLEDLRVNCFVDRVNPIDHPNINAATQRTEGMRLVFFHIISRMKMSMTDFYLRKEKK